MNERESDFWIFGQTDEVLLPVVEACDEAKFYWMAQGANSLQLNAAIDAAFEVQIIAAMWPLTPDQALRPELLARGWLAARGTQEQE